MKKLSILMIGVALMLGCNRPLPETPDTREADKAEILKADQESSRVAEGRDLEGHLGYFLDDASALAPNEPIVTGKEAIRKTLAEMYSMPGFSIKWQPTTTDVSRSGDLGYSIGTYQLSMNDTAGNAMTDNGKYLTLWKKQEDGSWKIAADMFNSDLPLPSMK